MFHVPNMHLHVLQEHATICQYPGSIVALSGHDSGEPNYPSSAKSPVVYSV